MIGVPDRLHAGITIDEESSKAGIRSRVVRGTVVSVLGQGGSKVLRLISNMILSRLLFPEAFGLMAMANLLVMGLSMISDVGILPNIIQHKRGDDPAFLDTAWTIQALRGAALLLLGGLFAVPVALFYEQRELIALAPVACLAALFNGFESTNLASMRRKIELSRVVVIELVSQVAAMVVMIAHAYLYRNVWSLVLGSVVGAAIRCLLTHTILPGIRNTFRIDRDSAREIFSFGKWVFLSTLITYLATRLDYLLLGKLLRLGDVGVYYLAAILAYVPVEIAGMVIGSVLLPAFSEAARRDRATLEEYFLKAQGLVLSAGSFAMLATIVLAPAFFWIFYDDRYLDAGWMVQLAMISSWFLLLQESHAKALLALGDARTQALANLVKLFASAALAIGLFHLFGLPGFLIGLGIGSMCGHLVVLLELRRQDIPALTGDLRWTVLGLLLALVAAGGPHLVRDLVAIRVEVSTAIAGALVLLPLGWVVAKRLRAHREVTVGRR